MKFFVLFLFVCLAGCSSYKIYEQSPSLLLPSESEFYEPLPVRFNNSSLSRPWVSSNTGFELTNDGDTKNIYKAVDELPFLYNATQTENSSYEVNMLCNDELVFDAVNIVKLALGIGSLTLIPVGVDHVYSCDLWLLKSDKKIYHKNYSIEWSHFTSLFLPMPLIFAPSDNRTSESFYYELFSDFFISAGKEGAID